MSKVLILILFILLGCNGETSFNFSGFVDEEESSTSEESTPTFNTAPTNDIDLSLGLGATPVFQFDGSEISQNNNGEFVWETTSK